MFKLIDKTPQYTIIELPAATRTLKMMGINVRRGQGLAPYPKFLQLPYTQIIIRPNNPIKPVLLVTQSADSLTSYNSQVSFPILPNIYRDFHICTGDLPDYTVKTIVDSFYLYDWQLVDAWSCAKVLQSVFNADTPQNALRNWEKLSKQNPKFVMDLLRHNKGSHTTLKNVVDGKVALDLQTGKLVPIELMKPMEAAPAPAAPKKKSAEDMLYEEIWGQHAPDKPAAKKEVAKKANKYGYGYYKK